MKKAPYNFQSDFFIVPLSGPVNLSRCHTYCSMFTLFSYYYMNINNARIQNDGYGTNECHKNIESIANGLTVAFRSIARARLFARYTCGYRQRQGL